MFSLAFQLILFFLIQVPVQIVHTHKPHVRHSVDRGSGRVPVSVLSVGSQADPTGLLFSSFSRIAVLVDLNVFHCQERVYLVSRNRRTCHTAVFGLMTNGDDASSCRSRDIGEHLCGIGDLGRATWAPCRTRTLAFKASERVYDRQERTLVDDEPTKNIRIVRVFHYRKVMARIRILLEKLESTHAAGDSLVTLFSCCIDHRNIICDGAADFR